MLFFTIRIADSRSTGFVLLAKDGIVRLKVRVLVLTVTIKDSTLLEVVYMRDKIAREENSDRPSKKKSWWARLLERMEKGGKEALKSGCAS